MIKSIIIEDEINARALLRRYLEKYCQVEVSAEAGSVAEGITAILEHKPDIVFLDLNLPIIDGWECLRKLKAIPRYKTIPVVVYTTSSYKEDEVKALQLGASHFLTKPYIFLDICTALTRLFSTEFGSVQ